MKKVHLSISSGFPVCRIKKQKGMKSVDELRFVRIPKDNRCKSCIRWRDATLRTLNEMIKSLESVLQHKKL